MMRTYSSRYHRRHSGQALLLAVLVMVFAALLGVTFITVVAINVGQTGRAEERDKARQAAQAGLAFADLQLTNSVWATRWNPADPAAGGNVPPATTADPTYFAYWTPFDQAQGWDSAGYVKMPDPRSVNPSTEAPNYMLKVERVLPNDPQGDNATGDKTGALRITSIGLSTDDPTTYYKVVAYKGGPAQQPGTRGAMEVTNWDFQNETVPVAQALTGSGTTLTVNNLQGSWPPVPFYIMRGDPAHGGTVERHIVTAVAGNALTLSATTPISAAVTAGERVELAAALGAPLAIDYNADGTADTTVERVDFQVSKDTIPSVTYANIPGSTYVNGGLIWEGNAYAQRLLAPRLATASAAAGAVKSTGLIYTAGATTVGGTIDDGGSGTAVSGTLQSSNNGAFPFTGGGTTEQRLQLVEDGWNRLAGSPDATRQVKVATPPDITVGGQGFGRYRQLTKYSRSTDAANPQAAAYGYGEGIYINNPQDRERKRTGTAGRYADMTQAELMDLWFSADTGSGNKALRLSEPAETLPTSAESELASLEEMHLRGWVAPNEFLARGALIELDPVNAKIYITLESRNDGRATSHPNGASTLYPYMGSVPAQGWRNTDGSLDGDVNLGGVYRKELDWPANGVIFAEGNLRVRGGAFDASGNVLTTADPGRSLTIVSMNNIYIEGSLNAGQRKVMLLAKKNVLMNPTAAIQKAEAQTRLIAAPSGTDISVHDATGFLPGDEIVLGASGERRMVQAIVDDQTLRLTAAPTTGGAGEVVKLVEDPLREGNRVYHQYATRISNFRDAVQRRIFLQGAPAELRLAMRHSAERREAMQVTTVQANLGDPSNPPELQTATMANKMARSAVTTIIQADHSVNPATESEKQLDVAYTDTSGSGDARFPDTMHPDEVTAMAYSVGNNAVATDGLSGEMNNSRSAPQWHYDVDVVGGYDQYTNRPPAHFLAAVGNKWDIDPATAAGTYPYRRDIFVGTSYTIPMATSVKLNLNGLPQTVRSDYYNTALSSFEFVKQFGFNFNFGAGATNDYNTWEDVLTVDQSFYRNGTGSRTTPGYDNVPYILDSRVLKGNDTVANNFAQGWNTLSFNLEPQAENYFDPTNPPAAGTPAIPYYRLANLKLENANQLNGDYEFETLAPGYTFDVRAYIYAQEGSWLVIPGGYYDEHIRMDGTTPYVDLPDAAGNYNGIRDAGEGIDLNRDGVVSRAEQAAVYRYRRYNYQVNVIGAIMQKTTPVIQDPDGTGPMIGYVSDWMDKWSTVKTDAANFTGTTGPFSNNLAYNADPALSNFATISYTFDPTAALGTLDADAGFQPPISPGLIYQTG